MTLYVDNAPLRRDPFQRIPHLRACAWHDPAVGWRLYFDQAAQVRLAVYGKKWTVAMPARGMLTIRRETEHLTPTVAHADDFRSGGGWGIDPFGRGSLLEHDRIVQRCALGLYDVDTGWSKQVEPNAYNLTRFAALPGYPVASEPRPFDGQHLVRAVRVAMGNRDDAFVRMDLAAIAYDASLAWSEGFERQILAMPGGRGHGACGREWAWVAWVAALARDRKLANRMRRIAEHVAQPWGGLLRQAQPWYHGSPHPWGSQPAGSDVPDGVDVAQDIECYHSILALEEIGCRELASRLADSVLAKPLRKWINADTGEGVGSRYAALDQVWIGLSSLATFDLPRAVEYAKAWPVMTPGGSQIGPFDQLADTRKALIAWNQPGKCGPFLELTGGDA